MADHDEHDPRDEGIRLLASDQPAPAASTPSVWAAAAGEDLDELLLVSVDRPADKRRLGTDRDRQRVERLIDRAVRRRLRHLPTL